MKRIYLFIVLYLLVLLSTTDALSQTLVSSGGDSYTNPAHTYSLVWSLGELVIETYKKDANVLTQGFHQTLLVPNGIEEQSSNSDKPFYVYPNPSWGDITIQLRKNIIPSEMPNRFDLFDGQGRLIKTEEITQFPFVIKMNEQKQAFYYLRLFNSTSTTFYTLLVQKIN